MLIHTRNALRENAHPMAAKLKGNAVLAQSGGPTAVINASIAGVVTECLGSGAVGKVYGALHGILGVLREDLVDLGAEDPRQLELLRSTPSAALLSCRRKLTDADYDRIMAVFEAHDVRYFFYNGGNDSMDTAHKVGLLAEKRGWDLRVMGVPKTVDNDLGFTDHTPGYGSVARWLAASVRDAGLDTEAIGTTDTVKVIETMGRNAGWITAATALAKDHPDDDRAPHLIYLPEVPLTRERFCADVEAVYGRLGHCVVAVCEGLKDPDGGYLTASGSALDTDGFGHKQLGGVASLLCEWVAADVGLKARWDKPGTIQRVSGAHQSPVDAAESFMCGREAARQAFSGTTGFMVTLVRESDEPYKCATGLAKLEDVANAEKPVPGHFINEGANGVTEDFIRYARPLIGGPLTEYCRLGLHRVDRVLPAFG